MFCYHIINRQNNLLNEDQLYSLICKILGSLAKCEINDDIFFTYLPLKLDFWGSVYFIFLHYT